MLSFITFLHVLIFLAWKRRENDRITRICWEHWWRKSNYLTRGGVKYRHGRLKTHTKGWRNNGKWYFSFDWRPIVWSIRIHHRRRTAHVSSLGFNGNKIDTDIETSNPFCYRLTRPFCYQWALSRGTSIFVRYLVGGCRGANRIFSIFIWNVGSVLNPNSIELVMCSAYLLSCERLKLRENQPANLG